MERVAFLKRPKSEEHKRRISETLSVLTLEQRRYLQEEFVDEYGARGKLVKEWGVGYGVLSRALKP